MGFSNGIPGGVPPSSWWEAGVGPTAAWAWPGCLSDVEYPGQVDELILLSPFVGKDEAMREIQASGGVGKWMPGPLSEDDFTRRLWLKLRDKWLVRRDRPKVWLGCGYQDRLAASNRQFVSDFLKPCESLWQDGGHDWTTWRELFRNLSAR